MLTLEDLQPGTDVRGIVPDAWAIVVSVESFGYDIESTVTVTRYVWRPFQREPDFGVTSVNYDFAELISRSARPR